MPFDVRLGDHASRITIGIFRAHTDNLAVDSRAGKPQLPIRSSPSLSWHLVAGVARHSTRYRHLVRQSSVQTYSSASSPGQTSRILGLTLLGGSTGSEIDRIYRGETQIGRL